MRRLLPLALVVVVAALALAAADNETGPNFIVPPELSPDAAEQYQRGLSDYKAARESRAGQTEKIAAAIRSLKRAKDLAPKFAPPRYYLGILYQWTKEFEKARQVLAQACDLNPTFHQAVVELGDTYLWLKQPDKALAEYDRAVAMKPDYGHAYSMRGYVRMKNGDCKAALEDFERAKKLAGKEPDPFAERAYELAKSEVDGPGWKTTYTCETDHYKVMTPVSQELADDIGKHAELIFKTYTKIFPKIGKEKRKFPVLVYASRDDYHASGAPQTAAGHYDPLIRKLVFFQEAKDADTKIVLYHEGFHQFLHDYLEDAPQWFNEGLGDFFGPSRYIAPKKPSRTDQGGMELRPNPWRLRHIQMSIQAGKIRGWRQLMLMSQAELYEDEWAGIHYAESWSIIFFLVRGGAPPGAEAGPYFKLLQDYFTALRKGGGQESAFDAAFGKVDVPKLEAEWKKFTLGLRPDA